MLSKNLDRFFNCSYAQWHGSKAFELWRGFGRGTIIILIGLDPYIKIKIISKSKLRVYSYWVWVYTRHRQAIYRNESKVEEYNSALAIYMNIIGKKSLSAKGKTLKTGKNLNRGKAYFILAPLDIEDRIYLIQFCHTKSCVIRTLSGEMEFFS